VSLRTWGMSYKKLGQFIQPINNRNKDLKVERLLGVSIRKVLMPSIANTIGTNMKTYKIIKKHQFAYGPVTSRNGDKISIALLEEYDEAIVSQAYTVFEIIDSDILDSEYLMMWFRRPEFDRYARFKSHGSARETFDWDEVCSIELPIPSIEKQQEIVKEYNMVVNRIELNETINQKLEKTAQALYKHWFVDFEFPNEEGKPYKSSGGKMVFNEELDIEIPLGWEIGFLKYYANYATKRISVNDLTLGTYVSTDNMLPNKKGVDVANKLPTVSSVAMFKKGDILLSNIRPYLKKIWQASFKGGASNDVLCLVPKVSTMSSYIYTVLEQDSYFDYVMQGAKGTKMPRGDKDWIMNFSFAKPTNNIIELFSVVNDTFLKTKLLRTQEKRLLINLSELLLSNMTKIEAEKEMV
jgi:type I restriction enzyme S subunit